MGEPDIYDVIILGAGLSGLVAAHTLIEKEPAIDVKILEAKGRIGGRTLSIPVQGNRRCMFDIGAQWLSSSQVYLMGLVESLNLTIVPQFRSGLAIGISNNCVQNYRDHPLLGNYFSQIEVREFFAKLEKQSRNYKRRINVNSFEFTFYNCFTMESYIRTKLYTTAAQNVALNIIRITCGIRPAQISVWDYLSFCNGTLGFTNQYMLYDNGAKEFWIKETSSAICNNLQERIGYNMTILNDPVVEIDHTAENEIVTLTASGKVYRSYFLICAIPPEEVLRIRFNPPFNKITQAALEQVQTGHVTKFIITYASPFWRRLGYSGEVINCDEGPINICYDNTKDGNAALTGYINEPSAIENQDNTYREQVIAQLAEHFGEDARDPIDYVEKNWWGESYVGGCPVSCPGMGTSVWHHALKQHLGRIYWAGTETATEWTGYMEGAVQSGRRAGMQVMSQIRPQALTYRDYIYEARRPHIVRLTPFQLVNTYTIAAVFVVGFFLIRFFRQ